MAEKIKNESGQINDPEVARQMAEVEAPYHEKTLGVIPPTEGKIKKGEKAAENLIHVEGIKIEFGELPPVVTKLLEDYQQEHEDSVLYGYFRRSEARKVLDDAGRVSFRILGVTSHAYPSGAFRGDTKTELRWDMEGDRVVNFKETRSE